MTNEKMWRPSARFGRAPLNDITYEVNTPRDTLKTVLLCGGIAAVIAAAVFFGWRGGLFGGGESQVIAPAQTTDPPSAFDTRPLDNLAAITQPVYLTPTPRPNQQELEALDLSGGETEVASSDENINLPSLIPGEIIYSSGTGTARLPVLKDLFVYDMEAATETKIAEASITHGEIYETVISQRWFVYIDTNQNGTNQICYIDRFAETPEVMLVTETAHALPKLRLYDDYLVWIEQTPQGTDEVWFFELGTAENFPVRTLEAATTYGVSAPSIFQNEIIWAEPDPDQSEADREANGEKSAIFVCDIRKLGDENYLYEHFSANTYVHEPITNGESWAWIDKNWAPDSGLYFKYRNGSNVIKVSEGVTSFALGDGILVYAKNMQIWVYFYESNTYARLTSPTGAGGMLPVVSGRHVVWYDLSDRDVDKLVYKVVLLPGETAPPMPTPKPTPSPTPPPQTITADDMVDIDIEGESGTAPATTPNPNATPNPGGSPAPT